MRDVLTLDGVMAMDPSAAAALFAYRQADGAADLDATVLAEWLAADPSHAEAWINTKAAWRDFDDSEDDEILAALRADARLAGPSRYRWIPKAAAAVAVLTIGGLLGTALLRPNPTTHPATSAGASAPVEQGIQYATAHGVSQSFSLADGTRMRLGPDSVTRVSLSGGGRNVRLVRGAAVFEVAHDASRPFAVTAARQEIIALGTRFEVTVRPPEVGVVLVEGRVSVRPVGATTPPTLLRPGQQLLVQEGQAPRVSSIDLGSVPIVQEDYIDFRDVTLAEAARVLSSRGAGRLIVREPKISQLRISGRFKADDIPRFGRALGLLLPVRLARRGEKEWEVVWAR
ncbi:FecR family protein [Caulobacter sp. 602-1]|uniref:FecR family protein n=1 Tax=Caulobacter sp. 602-1 TaxID=2492472 RepID=UPI000F6448EB|nr:FecR domain-containing protein [Caulobacter sp. 602-1]RRN63523.1 hypothetical protein EIK80_17080 [Caulobacter sp. 602-1]